MAGHAGRRRAGRTGPRVADAHRAHPPTGRTLRHPAAAAHRRSGDARRPRGWTPQEDGSGMEVKPGYKQTDVGVIPAEWEVRSIGQMFRLINGCPFKPEDWKQSGTPIVRIQNLNDPSAAFNYSQAPVLERNSVEPGDLLFAWSGTIGTSFGARVWAGPSGVLNQHIFKVFMDERKMTDRK